MCIYILINKRNVHLLWFSIFFLIGAIELKLLFCISHKTYFHPFITSFRSKKSDTPDQRLSTKHYEKILRELALGQWRPEIDFYSFMKKKMNTLLITEKIPWKNKVKVEIWGFDVLQACVMTSSICNKFSRHCMSENLIVNSRALFLCPRDDSSGALCFTHVRTYVRTNFQKP